MVQSQSELLLLHKHRQLAMQSFRSSRMIQLHDVLLKIMCKSVSSDRSSRSKGWVLLLHAPSRVTEPH